MTNLQGASEFERAAIEHILKDDAPEYKEHLRYLLVDKRENTGVGIYVNFKYIENPLLFSSEDRTLGTSVYAEIEGLESGAGFMLYIDEGRITMLESFCHGYEAWPAHISRFKIQNLQDLRV